MDSRNVPYSLCGKILVANGIVEEERLSYLFNLSQRNGVLNLKKMSPSDVRKIASDIRCTAAVFSPGTGILETHTLMETLVADQP